MKELEVKVFYQGENELPKYQTEGSAGMDLYADNDEPIVVRRGEVVLVPTNLKVAIPEGVEAQVRMRSGLALKQGLFLVNGVGTIDSDYRGGIGLIISKATDGEFVINKGDRVAQVVFNKLERVKWIPVNSEEELGDTVRGERGYGHTKI